MTNNLNDRIQFLEEQIANLNSQLQTLIEKTAEIIPPTSIVGQGQNKRLTRVGSPKKNISGNLDSGILWNDTEQEFIPFGKEPANPEISINVKTGTTGLGLNSYNKHTHSRFNGGAVIFDKMEVVDYDYTKDAAGKDISQDEQIKNPHSQDYWNYSPFIKTEINSKGETIAKIGPIDFIFDVETKKWGVAALEIDVRKVNFVMRDDKGELLKDASGNNISAPIYFTSQAKTSILWDASSKCWRFYAVYAPSNTSPAIPSQVNLGPGINVVATYEDANGNPISGLTPYADLYNVLTGELIKDSEPLIEVIGAPGTYHAPIPVPGINQGVDYSSDNFPVVTAVINSNNVANLYKSLITDNTSNPNLAVASFSPANFAIPIIP